MLFTAAEASALVSSGSLVSSDDIKKVGHAIRAEAAKGRRRLCYGCPDTRSGWRKGLIRELREAGYVATDGTTNQREPTPWIDISWG